MTFTLEELEVRCAQAQTGIEEIHALNQLAWELRHSQAARALELCQKAHDLMGSLEMTEPVNLQCKADRLTTLAFINHQAGKMDLALAQCLEALGFMEAIPPTRTTVDALRISSWIYYFVGDLARALEIGLKAFRLAQELDLKIEEASTLDGLAMVYAATVDIQQALQSQDEAIRIAKIAGNRILEAVIMNNQASNLLEMGHLSAAQELCEGSLALAREMRQIQHEIPALDTLGQIFQKQGNYEKAEAVLLEALRLSLQEGLELGYVYCLLSLGRIYLEQQKLEQAEALFQDALNRAIMESTQPIQADCHALLSQTYEQQGQFTKALEHYKMFYNIHEIVKNDTSGNRLAVLKVAHQVETAKRDAEIYRLRNIELQREIEERIRLEAQLEHQATVDGLTNIFNRRYFYEIAQQNFEYATRHRHSLTILMIDIDHFKVINDTFGHACGDQVLALLSAFLRKSLRGSDLLGRYGGEEFCAALLDTSPQHGAEAAERIRHNLAHTRFTVQDREVSVTISVGVASLPENGEVLDSTLDQIIDRADQALLAAKRAGRNQIKVAPLHSVTAH